MNEIICIQVGQCGNEVGAKFWEKISYEYGIDSAGFYNGENDSLLEKISVFYNDRSGGKYTARTVLVDLDPDMQNTTAIGNFSGLFENNSFIFGQNSTGNNYAKGYYSDGTELIDPVLQAIQTEADNCDSLQGFILFHSLGGGTGSGLGSLILNKLREKYPEQIIATFSVLPSAKVSDTVVEPYNAILALRQLSQYADMVFCIDNEALYDICYRELKITSPTYDDLNHLASIAISGITNPLRLPVTSGSISTLKEIKACLVRSQCSQLHFLTSCSVPLTARGSQIYRSLSTQELIQKVSDKNNMLAAVDPGTGRCLAAHIVLCGDLDMKIDEQISQYKNTTSFATWLPADTKASLSRTSPLGQKAAAIGIFNSTAIRNMFARIGDQFSAMLQKKAFVHWYTGEGMNEDELSSADNHLKNLISEYQKQQA
jgi:tubulin beta